MYRMNTRRGFTLIELLVVIGIIGLLSTIVLASLNGARQKGRDARRLSDIKQLQLALELYYDANGQYPSTLGTGATGPLASNGYIPVVPTDPSDNRPYAYTALIPSGGTMCSSYHLGASLEASNSNALSTDSDVTTLSPVAGETQLSGYTVCSGGTDFHGADSAACISGDTGTACYDIKP